MATKFRGVRGGTAFGEPLCRTCSYGHYQEGASISSARLICNRMPENLRLMKQEMYECSLYDDKRIIDQDFYEEIAWKIWTDADGNKKFVNPGEYRLLMMQQAQIEVAKRAKARKPPKAKVKKATA